MINRKTLFYVFAVLALVQMVTIFVFSAQPAEISDETSASVIEVAAKFFNRAFEKLSLQEKLVVVNAWQTAVRKLAHFLVYTCLGFLLMGTADFADRFTLKQRVYAVNITGLLYAISDEVHQAFVPGRSPQATDVLLDFSGILAGAFVFTLVHIIWRRYKNRLKKRRMV